MKRLKFYNSVLYEHSHAASIEEISKSRTSYSCHPFNTCCKHPMENLQTHYGPLGQKYLGVILSGKKALNIDNVYGIYFSCDGTMLDDKRIDLDKNDDTIVDRKRYPGTPGLY